MNVSTPFSGDLTPERIAALHILAPSAHQANAAVQLWAMGQLLGWDEARRRLSRAKWYRDLALLDQIGLAVPVRPWKTRRRNAAQESYTATTLADLYARVGQPFEVVEPWDPEFYPAGTTGYVYALLLRDARWLFELALHGSPGGTAILTVAQALRCCAFDPRSHDHA